MYFFDTCALVNNYEILEEKIHNHELFISNISLIELESIKTSKNKNYETIYRARKVTNILNQNFNDVNIINYFPNNENKIPEFETNNDYKIISCALAAKQTIPNIKFVTEDLSCYNIARTYNLDCVPIDFFKKEEYKGYVEINTANDTELTEVYNNIYLNNIKLIENRYSIKLEENEYLILLESNKIIDFFIYLDGQLHNIKFNTIDTKRFGQIKPLDTYQILALDSLNRNQITILRGPAGSGKSYLGLGFLFSKLEAGEIDKIIIFCNTVATADSAKLGFYPGSKNSKLLDSQIGNFLASKLGDMSEVERLINDGSIILIPMSDCRGFDTTGMRAGIYCTEGQNMTIDMMKLLLQRIGDDSFCIIEGDNKAQVDLNIYSGSNNGLSRAIEVFKGEKIFGTVTLPNVHRSKIAEIAERM